MYRIMIVDDEPPFIRIIKKLIDRHADCFEVIGEAYDGLEALDIIPQAKPDVIFTDIKMPGMDGIEFLEKVNSLYPDILPVIVSGYRDFEYAKGALKTGAMEYLLKPINVQMMDEVLRQLSRKLGMLYMRKERELLCALISNRQVSKEELRQFFDYRGFMCAIARKGALAGRYMNSIPYLQDQQFGAIDFGALAGKLGLDRCWLLDGSDENEVILVTAMRVYDGRDAGQVFECMFKELDSCIGNITMVYGPVFHNIDQLAVYLGPVKKSLAQCIVIGSSQVIDFNRMPVVSESMLPIIDKATENKLLSLIESRALKLLKAEFFKMFMDWEHKRYPQMWVSKMLKQVMTLVEKHSPSISAAASMSLEQQLEEVMSISGSLRELLSAVWDIVEDMLGDMERNRQEGGYARELLEKVDLYLKTNLADVLSLQGVCKIFGISQPYLSRLFRRYKNVSFNEYVTGLKIEKAKQLMAEYPEMLLKDIAEVIGFRDQYYFSRIFKYITGTNPSEYRTEAAGR